MLTQARLKELLHYDPLTGIFSYAASTRLKSKGQSAGHKNVRYWKIRLDRRIYCMHILAWLYMTGEYPPEYLDHEDNDGFNNIWSNLRLASRNENAKNRKLNCNSTSGFKGISWHKRNSCWVAYVNFNGSRHYLGSFSEIEQAVDVVRSKREELHGEFARHE